MTRSIFFVAVLSLPSATVIAQTPMTLNTEANLRGLSVVNDRVVWVSGTGGTFVRTGDGGLNWVVRTVPGAEKLDFRDVEAFGETTAYLLSAGPGEDSRIYKTSDGGKNWQLQFKNLEPKAFYDAMAFWNEKSGIALSDPVNGRFQIITTNDGGEHWNRLPEDSLPKALPDEGAFAASGTCLVTSGDKNVWFATGGGKTARVFHSADRGQNWQISETPMIAGAASAGIFSLHFRDRQNGMAVGGDYLKPNEKRLNAVTNDGGKTWKAIDSAFGYRSAVGWAKDRWFVVGTSGSNYSIDDAKSWKSFDHENYNSVAFATSGLGWAVGPKGRITRMP